VGEQLWNIGLQGDWKTGSHLLVAGAELLVERMDADRLREGAAARNRLGLYVQDEWALAPSFRLAPGLRVELQEDRDPVPAPRLAARWDVVETVALRGSYGWAFRAPSFQELMLRFENPSVGYVVEGNAELLPETSRGATLGAEWKPSRALRASVELFRHDIDDMIAVATVREPRAGVQRGFGYVNVDRAVSQGVESRVVLLPVRSIELHAAYAFTDARNANTGAYLEGRARDRVSAGASWRSLDTGTDASLQLHWTGPRPFPDGDGITSEPVEAPAHVQLAAHVRQAISGGFSLLAGGSNLLNEGSAAFLPLAPRTVYGGVAFRY